MTTTEDKLVQEAAEQYLKNKEWRNFGSFNHLENTFKEGVKWQQEKSKDTEIKCKKIILSLLVQLNGGLEYASIVDELLTKEVNLVDRLYKRYCRDNELNDKIVENFK